MAFAASGAAQEERPQITPGERKAPRKKDAGPRAIAVLQLSPDGKASLVPIAILMDGKFWDATAYKADPVPMALDSGTVYEAEQSGSSMGLFTVSSALHRNTASDQAPWIGTGAWRPAGTDEPKKGMQAESVPVGIDTTDAPPRLTHSGSSSKEAPASPAPSSGEDNKAGASTGSTKASDSSNSGDGPPRLTKGTPDPEKSPEASTKTGGNSSATASGSNEAKPAASAPSSDSGASEGNRPRLRREKPAESFADEDVPGYSKPGSTAATATGAAKTSESTTPRNDVKLVPAISDAAGPAPRSFKFEWLKGEEGDRRKQMMDLAKEQLRAYVAARSKATVTPKTARPKRSEGAKAEPILDNVQMRAFDLWNSNQAIIVFSADAHMPPPPAGTAHSEVESEMQYSILLVAYPDIYNSLRKIYSGITDKYHLDMTPRLELVDAVDADGDGRGELLFRETSDTGRGWVIYRASPDKLWKLFDSLSAL